jgi:toxin YoeB
VYNPSFSVKAWDEYLEWLTLNRKNFNRINTLIKDIQRNGPLNGIGCVLKLGGAIIISIKS